MSFAVFCCDFPSWAFFFGSDCTPQAREIFSRAHLHKAREIMVAIRQALAVPEADDASVRLIEIRHPAYPDTNPALLRLNAVDNGGIDYDTAFVACGIVTGNTWSRAWLATRDADSRAMLIAGSNASRDPPTASCVKARTTCAWAQIAPSSTRCCRRLTTGDFPTTPFPGRGLASPFRPRRPIHSLSTRLLQPRVTARVASQRASTHVRLATSSPWRPATGLYPTT